MLNSLGRITEVSGKQLTATLHQTGDSFISDIKVDDQTVRVGQVGSYMIVEQGITRIVTIVTRAYSKARKKAQNAQGDIAWENIHHVTMIPVGELNRHGDFVRGVDHFPTLGAALHIVTRPTLRAMFSTFEHTGFKTGYFPGDPKLPIYFDPSKLFGRHLAILGQSGAGKSWTVTSLLQKTIEQMPNAHIVLLDLHGEYAWKDKNGQLNSAFKEGTYRYLDARELEIPYWLLTYSELVDLLIDRSAPGASTQIAFLRETVFTLRKKANQHLKLPRLSVDSPVYFPLAHLFMSFKKANEQVMDFGKEKGALNGQFDEFLVKLQSKLNDARYDFLFKPKRRTSSETLTDLLNDFIGQGKQKAQITIIDLSPIPADVRPTVSAQIGRLAFEFNYWNPDYREFPIALVCEEAHAYIPRSRDAQYEGTRKAMEKIAKEGRKYGVSLVVVSQRPTELSETVLAQCGSYICLRITNPDDQDYIRKLVPEGEADLADTLSSLGRGEALALGEAVPLPTRVQIYMPDPPPHSDDVDFQENWNEDSLKTVDMDAIVARWRNQIR